MKRSTLILIGVASYLIFVIIQTPAIILHQLVAEDNPAGIKLGRLQGTLWQGKADAVQIQNHKLTDLQWSFSGWQLLLGRLAAAVEAQYQQQPITTDLSLSVSGTLALHNTHAVIDAGLVGDLIQMPIGQLNGSIELQLEHVELAQGTVPLASGIISWRQASITVAETASLGDVKIRLGESDAAPLIAIISNAGGDIKLDGDASVTASGDYKLLLNMLPSAGANRNIRNSLKLFAKPKANGGFEIDTSGNLEQLGIM
jgi:hypothetical protein